jgi:opacity protein-like surface antigen
MKNYLFSLRSVALGAIIAAVAASSAQAATTSAVDTSICSNPVLSQPFLAAGDFNWYTLMPGETPGNFDGSGWTLSGGAKIVTTTIADGSTASVLDLPSGSKAVSPTICVTSAYPTERAMVRDVVGSEGVFVYVSYEGTSTWNTPKNTGQMHGSGTAWTLATPVNLQPYNTAGWQPMRITLIPGGKTSNFELYNLYIDPHARF